MSPSSWERHSPTHPTAAPRTLETISQGIGRQEVPASWGAFGPKSSLVAKLLLGPGPISTVTTGQAGSQGPATLCPTPQMGCSQRLQCPPTLSSVSHPTLKPSQAIQGGTHSRVGQGCSWLLGQWACRAELLGAGRKETGQMKYREQPETLGGSLMPHPPPSLAWTPAYRRPKWVPW